MYDEAASRKKDDERRSAKRHLPLYLADGGFFMLVLEFKYSGLIFDFSLTSDAGVHTHIKSTTSMFGALRDSIPYNKSADLGVKRRLYVALMLGILL